MHLKINAHDTAIFTQVKSGSFWKADFSNDLWFREIRLHRQQQGQDQMFFLKDKNYSRDLQLF